MEHGQSKPSPYVRADEVERTIQAATKTADDAIAIRRALDELTKQIDGTVFKREDGVIMKPDRGLVDAGFQTQAVYKWARATQLPYMASMGFGVGAKQKPWDTIKRARGERAGFGWRMPSVAKTSGTRRVDIDTNTWKTAVIPKFAMPADEPGHLRLFKRSPSGHRMAGDHLASEFPVKTTGRGRELYEWSKRPNAENHILDCVIEASVAANMAGARLPHETTTKRPSPPKSAAPPRGNVAEKTSTGGQRAEDKRDNRERLSMKEMRERTRRGKAK